jgi:heat shock protein HslJ
MKTNVWQRVGWHALLAGVLVIALLAACGPIAPGTPTAAPATPDETGGQGDRDLPGSKWVLTSLRGQPLLPGTQITLHFEADQLGGFAGCNAYGGGPDSGGYELRDGELRIPLLASTAQACEEPEGVMDQEATYLKALPEATGYRIDGDALELLDAGGEAILTFRRQEEISMDPAALLGTAWNLISLNGQPLVDRSDITLAFADENRASGHAGCRDYVLGYEADEERIAFYYTAMLGPVCIGEGSQARSELLLTQEGAYTDALTWTDRFRLAEDGGQLELLSQRGDSLAFERLTPEALPPVEGPAWELLSFLSPNTAAGLDQPTPTTTDVLSGTREVSIRFDAGTARGWAGCNQYTAPYSLEGTQVSIEKASLTTKIVCFLPDGVMEQERRYLEWLPDVEQAVVRGRQLWLETGDGRALVFHAPGWESSP